MDEIRNRERLRMHIEAVWRIKLPPLDQKECTILPESALPEWQLCAADLAEGRVLIWRTDVEPGMRQALLTRLETAWDLPESALQEAGIKRLIAFCQETRSEMDVAEARQRTRRLTWEDAELIELFWPGEAESLLQKEQPLYGVIAENRLVSLAHSSRRTADACELGIDTLPEARRKGYALAATVAWTAAIIEEGLLPIYSAYSWNTASLRLAAASGYRGIGRTALLR